MEKFYITAMNCSNGYTKTFTVEADNYDHAVQIVESDKYETEQAPYGWEVVYEFD